MKDLSRRGFLKAVGLGAAAAAAVRPTLFAQATDSSAAGPASRPASAAVGGPSGKRPNVVWIMAEDTSPHMSCYGETTIQTPCIDALAAKGAIFRRCFSTSPVCSPSRSGAMTGMYPTTIGSHQHRSNVPLPAGVKMLAELFRQAGYYTAMGGEKTEVKNPRAKARKLGKGDYNFPWDDRVYDGADWSGRKTGQPFFAQVQLEGGKNRPPNPSPEDVAKVKLPPYYPDHPVLREDWARYLNSVRATDVQVGAVLKRLADEGISDETIVVFSSDHGLSHIRDKQFLYDGGIHVPLVIRWPKAFAPGTARDDLVSQIDVAPTLLSLCGLEVPACMEGQALVGPAFVPRAFVISARDRCDETADRIRGVRTDRYKYIRNYYPERSHAQPNKYKDAKLIMKTMRQLHAEGKLTPEQDRVFAPTRPKEELYDLQNDRWEMNNLAELPDLQPTLQRMRAILEDWIKTTDDKGQYPEPPRGQPQGAAGG